MTEAQKRLRELRDRQSRERQRMAELSRAESLTDETRAELDLIETGTPDLERQLRAATLGVEQEDAASVVDTRTGGPDAEHRERLELRGRASLGRYLLAHMRGKVPDGAEGELAQAAGVDGIPLELRDVERRAEPVGRETRAVSSARATVGVNLELRPAVFAPSVVDELMVDMPMVESGTYASGTITTLAEADAVPKGDAVPERGAVFTVTTTTPKRVGGSLTLRVEDIAAVGQANFESILRQHLSHVLSDELDDQLLNGDGANDALTGFFERLTDPAADPVAAADRPGVDSGLAAGADAGARRLRAHRGRAEVLGARCSDWTSTTTPSASTPCSRSPRRSWRNTRRLLRRQSGTKPSRARPESQLRATMAGFGTRRSARNQQLTSRTTRPCLGVPARWVCSPDGKFAAEEPSDEVAVVQAGDAQLRRWIQRRRCRRHRSTGERQGGGRILDSRHRSRRRGP